VNPLSKHNIFRALTGPFRIEPNFLIIGAQRCGTSSLFYYLSRHPFIKPSQKKEIRYFDRFTNLGMNWYKGNFPSKIVKFFFQKKNGMPFITGEATSSYIFHPSLPELISNLLPDVKIIALIRNPTDRAFSHYNMMKRVAKENLSFEQALEEESSRIKGEEEKIQKDLNYFSLPLNYYAYLHHGMFVNYLEKWLNYFPKDQMLIITTEELEDEPKKIFLNVTRFLGIPDWAPNDFPKKNIGSNQKILPETRKKLVMFFKPYNEQLYKLLGKNFDFDK